MLHTNSILSNRQAEKYNRRQAILDAYDNIGRPCTDRYIATYLGFADMNFVRPRTTEMIEEGFLCEVGKVKDDVTNRTVRICVKARDAGYEPIKKDLFL